MACTNCSSKTTTSGTPRGCNNNGSCGTDSCNKLNVFDWLANMQFPSTQKMFDVVEIRFKNGRKEFYKNTENLSLHIGDIVATEANPGHDIGIVTLTGELVKVQMKKRKVSTDAELPKIYRKATQKDIDIWTEARNKEESTKVRAREIAIRLNLEMKISDIEYQGDLSKAIFYYTANDRVDFRQLIKEFAREFGIRIEMKQIGFRQEAARLGGIGSCGRELCCSTWLTDFRSVNTAVARYQQLSLNPQKLAGQCGKLKCCLNYELDTYLDALRELPSSDTRLKTDKGDAICQKMDIFKGIMWFSYTENSANWYMLDAEVVKNLVEKNKKGENLSQLEDYVIENDQKSTIGYSENTFQNTLSEDSLQRFDQPKKKKNNQRRKRENGDVQKTKPQQPKADISVKNNPAKQAERPQNTRKNNLPKKKSNRTGQQINQNKNAKKEN